MQSTLPDTSDSIFSPNSRLFVITYSGSWRLFDYETGMPFYQEQSDCYGFVFRFVFSPDSAKIAGFQRGSGLHLWRADTGDLIHSIHVSQKSLGALVFSPDGLYMASGSEDGEICILDGMTTKVVQIYLTRVQRFGQSNSVMMACIWHQRIEPERFGSIAVD